jgi:hypothetical protein
MGDKVRFGFSPPALHDTLGHLVRLVYCIIIESVSQGRHHIRPFLRFPFVHTFALLLYESLRLDWRDQREGNSCSTINCAISPCKQLMSNVRLRMGLQEVRCDLVVHEGV